LSRKELSMKKSLKPWFLQSLAVVAAVLAVSALATAGTQYVITNDDGAFPFLTGVSFYTVGANGLPLFQQQVLTGGFGIGGGYFGLNRIAVLNSGGQACVYASEPGSGDIVGISINTLTVGGSAAGSDTDGGTSNGIGLAVNSTYLYASFTDSNTIGTFQVQPGCGLSFINDTSVGGSHGGIINAMAIHGNILIATYTDGTIESFDISGGTPLSNGDKQTSTATLGSHGATYVNSIDITSDGHYAIFGDTSTSLTVEISDLSSGKLAKTTVFNSTVSVSSSTLMLSPDETLLYVINTQGAAVSALFFNKTTGTLSAGCTSPTIPGRSVNWSYLAGAGLISQNGNGGGVYVAEFGSSSAIATVKLSVAGQTCSLKAAQGPPASDPLSPGLLSIGTYPPRSF
jgi:6-phosphogluconolactonase (cycloisomerase 2 family)